MGKQIHGIPESEYEYEFMVVQDCGDHFEFVMNSEWWTDEVEDFVKTNGYVVVHNVRVAHKQKKKVKRQ